MKLRLNKLHKSFIIIYCYYYHKHQHNVKQCYNSAIEMLCIILR